MPGATSPPSRRGSPPAFVAGGSWRLATVASLALHAAIGAWLVMDWRRMADAGGGAAEAALVVDWVPSQGEPDGADDPAAEAAAPPAPDLAAAAPAPPMPPLVQDVPPPPVIVPAAPDAPALPALAVPPPPLPQLAMAMPPVDPMPAPAAPVATPEPPPIAPPDPSERAEAEPLPEAPPPVAEQTVPVVPVEHLPTPPPSPPPPPQQVAAATPAPAPSTPTLRPALPQPAPRPATNAAAAHRPRRGTPDAAQQVAAHGPALAPASGAAAAQPDDAGSGPLVIRAPRYRQPPRPPQYPARALDLGLTGTVMVRALVSPDGETQETRLWRSSGHPLLDAAAIAAVRRWAFEPARHGGRAVPAWVEVPVHFRLN